MAYSLPGSMAGASKAGGTKGVATGPGKGVQTTNPYLSSAQSSYRQAAPKPAAPAPMPTGGGAPTITPSPVLTPAPTEPTAASGSMAGLRAAAGGAQGDSINGPVSQPLRPDLGIRQPPSLAALLQGLRY